MLRVREIIRFLDYPDLVKNIKKDPHLLDEFYSVMISGQNLVDVTKPVREKIMSDLDKI